MSVECDVFELVHKVLYKSFFQEYKFCGNSQNQNHEAVVGMHDTESFMRYANMHLAFHSSPIQLYTVAYYPRLLFECKHSVYDKESNLSGHFKYFMPYRTLSLYLVL